jgi:hypothetical protein
MWSVEFSKIMSFECMEKLDPQRPWNRYFVFLCKLDWKDDSHVQFLDNAIVSSREIGWRLVTYRLKRSGIYRSIPPSVWNEQWNAWYATWGPTKWWSRIDRMITILVPLAAWWNRAGSALHGPRPSHHLPPLVLRWIDRRPDRKTRGFHFLVYDLHQGCFVHRAYKHESRGEHGPVDLIKRQSSTPILDQRSVLHLLESEELIPDPDSVGDEPISWRSREPSLESYQTGNPSEKWMTHYSLANWDDDTEAADLHVQFQYVVARREPIRPEADEKEKHRAKRDRLVKDALTRMIKAKWRQLQNVLLDLVNSGTSDRPLADWAMKHEPVESIIEQYTGRPIYHHMELDPEFLRHMLDRWQDYQPSVDYPWRIWGIFQFDLWFHLLEVWENRSGSSYRNRDYDLSSTLRGIARTQSRQIIL